MPRYLTNAALSIKGDRIERKTEIELTAEEAAAFDPADITLVTDIPADEPEVELASVPLEEMTAAQLKERAKELGLSASGTMADLRERITLHLAGTADNQPAEGQGGHDENADNQPAEGQGEG